MQFVAGAPFLLAQASLVLLSHAALLLTWRLARRDRAPRSGLAVLALAGLTVAGLLGLALAAHVVTMDAALRAFCVVDGAAASLAELLLEVQRDLRPVSWMAAGGSVLPVIASFAIVVQRPRA